MLILPGASLISKSAFTKVGTFDDRLVGYEDDDLFARMFAAGFSSIYFKNVSVLKWRIYSNSTSHSPRMAKSRMIYFRKLVAAYPDEPRINQYWTRDVIGPRFLDELRGQFLQASRLRDLPRLDQAWSDIKEVLPVMHEQVRRRMQFIAPLIELVHRSPFGSIARELLRFGVRTRNRMARPHSRIGS